MPIRLLLPAVLAFMLLAAPAAARAGGYVPGEVIVKYRNGAPGAERLIDVGTARSLPGGSEQVAVREGATVREALGELRRDPDAAYAVPNYRAHASAAVPNDPGLRRQWNFVGPFGIGMPEAWQLAIDRGAPGGRGVVVAVLDSGVAYENRGRYRRAPDLRGTRFARGHDFVGRDPYPNDVFGHGTHVAGTIAQTTNNGIDMAGIAYGARIMPVRVLDAEGSGDSAAISRAVRWAVRHGADVINLSLEFPSEVRAAEIPDVISALRYARKKNVVVVAAYRLRKPVEEFEPSDFAAVLDRAAATLALARKVRVARRGTGTLGDLPSTVYQLTPTAGGLEQRLIYAFRGTTQFFVRCQWDAAGKDALVAGCEEVQRSFRPA